jgi:hypothetical protein
MGKAIAASAAIVVGFFLFIYALTWLGLVGNRPIQKYQEQTRKEVYDTSRQFQQGTNRDIARYCEQMRDAKEPTARRAVAALVRSTASTYDGPLSPDNADCVTEAKGN